MLAIPIYEIQAYNLNNKQWDYVGNTRQKTDAIESIKTYLWGNFRVFKIYPDKHYRMVGFYTMDNGKFEIVKELN